MDLLQVALGSIRRFERITLVRYLSDKSGRCSILIHRRLTIRPVNRLNRHSSNSNSSSSSSHREEEDEW